VAIRPRGVRASNPARTRNGSATVSTVSGSSATEPPEQRVEHRPVEPVEPELVDLVDVQGRPSDAAVDDAVGAYLGEVTHPSQQPVGDAGCPAGPSGDLLRAVALEPHAEEHGAADEHPLELLG
jgi:hypothetical protein